MPEPDYTGGDSSVGAGFQGNLTISHNVGGIVLLALAFLIFMRVVLQKNLI